jgi:ABC-type sulfate/molybdate transport systems ATPase subunit
VAILDLDFDLALPAFTVSAALRIGDETLALVGPSGAGKTTVLRAVAGLAKPERGRIELDGRPWFDAAAGISLAPEERSVGLVFQDYALFPHLSVRKNVAFGMRPGGASVEELLERFRITELAEAKPGVLSGGERQRVALARALARRPEVLLLDEPLSALDAHTRGVIRAELRELLDQLALPSIFITHDFHDAAVLAGRAAVIVAGQIRQVGPVASLASDPADAFVAALTGNNVLPATAVSDGGGTILTLEDGQQLRISAPASGPVGVVIAPSDVRLVAAPNGGELAANVVRGRVGALTRIGGRVEGRVGPLAVDRPAAEVAPLRLEGGDPAWLELPAEAISLVALEPG